MDILQDVLLRYHDFIDKTNTASIESGLSFHCLTMGGLFDAAHRLYDVLHNEGPSALFKELTSILFGSSGTNKSDTCIQRIIKADIRKIISTSAASAVSSLSILHIFSPLELARSLVYQFSAEFLKLLALKNSLSSYGRRLIPSEAFLTGSIAGLVTNFLFFKSKRKWLQSALRGGFKEMTAELIIRMVTYLVIEGINYAISQQIPMDDSLNLKIIRN